MRGMRWTVALLAALLSGGCVAAVPGGREAVNPADARALPYRVVESFGVGDEVFVRSLAVDRAANSLWVGTSVGVPAVDLTTRDPTQTFPRKEGLANEYVFAIGVDGDGNMWFGTIGGGVTRYRDCQGGAGGPGRGRAGGGV